MTKTTLALGLTLAATPLFADPIAFEPVTPDGLDAAALERVAVLQSGLPGQMPAFEAQGYAAWGAILVPQGVEITPQALAAVQGLPDAESAKTAGLEVCAQQFGTDCTVIGLLVPGE